MRLNPCSERTADRQPNSLAPAPKCRAEASSEDLDCHLAGLPALASREAQDVHVGGGDYEEKEGGGHRWTRLK